ncbi:MAG TPA: DNA-processing protein DprA, partial [Neisseria sp.]|nr:DNA-processing protein DprA [Neisseria sp.]
MERNEHERLAWLQLAFTPYIGAESFLALHRHFGSARAALAAPVDAVRGLLRQKQALRDWGRDNPLALKAVEAALNWEAQPDCRLMLLSDEDFPLMLTEGITPPPVLFLRGNTTLLQRPAVAVVGTRRASAYGCL